MPLGSIEMTVLDQAIGFAPLPMAASALAPMPCRIVRDLKGKLIYSFSENGPKPEKVARG